MDGRLREKLLGAWRLVDVVEEPVDGSPPRRPHGEQPIGLILYTPDGYMSAQIMARDRPTILAPDWSDLSAEDYAEEARGYFAYCGSFAVDEAAGTVTHSVEASLFPGWVGSRQPRVAAVRRRRAGAEQRVAGAFEGRARDHAAQLGARPDRGT